jgi:GT2 family glycosyltransferase
VVIICDDGSTDNTITYLKKYFPEVIVLQGNGNLWWTAGINMCIEKAISLCGNNDYILTINNDVIVSENYLEKKIQSSYLHPNSLIGSLCLFKHDHRRIETSAHIMDWGKAVSHSLTKFGEPLDDKHKGIVEVTYVCAKGVLIPAKVFKNIGLYDAKLFPQYYADADFALRAYKAGYKILLDYDSHVYSEINLKNIGIHKSKITIKAFLHTFKGHYSLNNYWVLNNFAKKHFPLKEKKFLIQKYFFIIGGFIKRFLFQNIRKKEKPI